MEKATKTINKDYLKTLNPGTDRWENFLKHYSDFNGGIVEFLELSEISWEDKKWVLFKEDGLLSENLMREFAMKCACRIVESSDCQEVKDYFDVVLHIYTSGETYLLNSEEYRAAYRAADRAAYWAADRAAEEEIQCEMLKQLVGECE